MRLIKCESLLSSLLKTAIFCSIAIFFSLVFLVPSNASAAVNVNVSSYGAAPNDAVDDGPAIRAAIDAAIADGAGSNVYFSSGKYLVSAPPREWGFNTNGNLESWTMDSQVSGSVSGGYLGLTVGGTSPTIKSATNLDLNGGSLPRVLINMKNNTAATTAKIYWITQTDSTWDEAKSMVATITANDTLYREYAFDLNSNVNWTGSYIKQIKVLPELGAGSGAVSIDYIKFDTVKRLSWGFDTAGSFEGWTMVNQVSGSVAGGSLTLTPSGIDPYIFSPDNLGLNSNYYSSLSIAMKNNTSSVQGTIYWTTTTDTTWDGTKKMTFSIIPNDTGINQYTINLGMVAAFNNQTIKQIRIDPEEGQSTGTSVIDSIKFNIKEPRTFYQSFDYKDVNLNFIGSNTELSIVNPVTGVFSFHGNSAVTFDGFTIDYETMPFSQGTITAVNSTNGTFDFQPDAGFLSIMDNVEFQSMPALWGTVREPGNSYINKKTANDNIPVTSWTKLNSTTYRLTLPAAYTALIGLTGQIEVNDKFVLVQRAHDNNVFTFIDSGDVSINNVTIYSSPQSPVVAVNHTGALNINNLNVLRRPSSGRWISVNGDGLHIQSSVKGPVVTNSTFEGLQDDGINFYQLPDLITGVSSTTQVKAYSLNNRLPAVGDSIVIYNNATGTSKGKAKVIAVTAEVGGIPATKRAILTFDTAIAGMQSGYDFGSGDAMYNLSRNYSNFKVSGSTFRQSRGNGIFTKGSDGIIENNSFSDLGFYYGGIELQNVPQIPEGPYATNVIIRNNTLNNVGYLNIGGWTSPQAAGIIISSLKTDFTATSSRNMKNIVIEGNTITHYPRSGIFIGSSENVYITGNNTITGYAGDSVFDSDIAGIKIVNSNNVLIDGMSITDPRAQLKAGVRVDALSQNVNIGTLNAVLASGVPGASFGDYLASSGFSGTKGANQWYYQQWNGSSYSNLTYDAANSRWMGTGAFTFIWSNMQHPDTGYDSVRKWVAPYACTVNITGTVSKADNNGNGVVASIWKNSTQMWSSTLTTTALVTPGGVTGISLNAGDALYFRLNNNGDSSSDTTYWNPDITIVGSQAPTANLYQASTGFSSQSGVASWFYQQWNGSSYSDLVFDKANSRWQGAAANTLILSNVQHPDTGYDSVRKWVAQAPGTVTITGTVSKADNNGNGVIASIWKNSTQLWSSTVATTTPVNPAGVSSITVVAGDAIYFRVNNNGNSASDSTIWDPLVSFLVTPIYQASKGFSGGQGENQWFYEQWNGSSYSSASYDSVNNRWKGTAANTLILSNVQHPDTGYDSVRKWVAPRAGTITITGAVSKVDNNGNGVIASILKNSTQLWSSTLTTTAAVNPTGVSGVTVAAGDAIYFKVNNNGDSTSDSTIWDPIITLK